MSPGDICLANFPFGAGGGVKLRPVLLLTGPVGLVPEVLVAYISSAQPPVLLPSDLVFDPSVSDHKSTNLKSISFLRLHKLATVHQRSVVRHLGQITAVTSLEVAAKLRLLLGL